jgi:hypothetical protein
LNLILTQHRVKLALISFLLAVLLSPLFVSLPAQAAQTSVIPDTDVVPYGVNTFLDKEVEYWKKERTMQMISESGVKWIKQIFAWNEIEFKKGYFNDDKNKKSGWQKFDEIVDLAAKYNVKIVARVDQAPDWAKPSGGKPGGRPANFQDYTDFLKEFVKHYKGKVQYITIWNEPNLEREWMPGQGVNAKDYVDMLKASYKAIKDTDPSVRVMAAPLAITLEENTKIALNELTYLDQMYKAGAKDYFDIMPANAYGLEFAPEAAPDPKTLNFRRVELLHQVMVKNGDGNKAVWFNEYGWNASPASIPKAQLTWGRVTEQQQADYTIRGYKYARQNWPWAGVIFVWFFRQVGDIPDSSSEQYFQMVTKDFTPKPIYTAIKQDALAFLQQRNEPTPAPVTAAVPATPTPVPGGTNPPAVVTQAAAGTPLATVQAGATVTAVAQAPTANPTVAPTRAAVTPTPAGQPGAVTTTKQDDSGSLIIIIIGVVLVLAGGGGLAYWFTQRRQG